MLSKCGSVRAAVKTITLEQFKEKATSSTGRQQTNGSAENMKLATGNDLFHFNLFSTYPGTLTSGYNRNHNLPKPTLSLNSFRNLFWFQR